MADSNPTAGKFENWQNFQYEQLARLGRQLQFVPSTTAAPKRLTPEQVASFNRDGFLTGLDVLPTDEIARYRQYFDDLLQKTLAAGGDSYSISTAHRKYRTVYQLAVDARILDLVEDLLGPNLVLWGSHFFCKMPGDGKAVAWHQDASYWPLTPSKTVTAWLAIDDSDQENGCMRVIPGSHHHGHLTWRSSRPEEHNVLDQTVEEAEQYGDPPVDLVLRAGQLSLHSDLLLHGSEPNRSTRRRCGLTLRYAAADVRAHLGWHEKGVVCRGHEPTGHWANYPPPETP